MASLTALMLSMWIVYEVFYGGKAELIEENNVVESSQVYLYIFSAVILLIKGFSVRHIDRWLYLFFGVTCLSFVFRELDVEDFDVPQIVILIGSGKGRNWIFIIAFTLLIHVFISRYMKVLKSFKQWKYSIVVQVCLFGCSMLLLGAIGDEYDMPLFEEVCELNGAFFIALSALLFIVKPQLLMNYLRNN
ncbi:MAG: hypothetical protein ACSHX6_08020 [Akkermansiaceae bacterium]